MNQISWGMPTLVELDTIEDNIKLCQSLGLHFIELNMNMPEYQPDRLDIDKLVHMKEESGIYYTIHLPEEFNIANFNDSVRTAYETIFVDTVELAKKLKAPILNMHMNLGVFFKLPSHKLYLYKKYNDYYMNRIRAFASLVTELLSSTEIKLSVENTGIFDLDFITAAVDELISKDNIVLTWDIGHDYSSGLKDADYILHNINKLKHMHIHDAIGTNNHLPLFTGDIDVLDRIRIASDQGCTCVIETKSVAGLEESVLSMKERGML